MSKLSQSKKVAEYLKDNANQRFTAKDIAKAITELYPEDYIEKRDYPRFISDQDFIAQVVAEIGAQKQDIIKHSLDIKWQDKPRPRVYWYNDIQININDQDITEQEEKNKEAKHLSEHELYPILIDYLISEHQLYCLRIDEKRSGNNLGSGGNQWLHPDIMAIEPVAQRWHQHVKACVLQGGGQNVRLWSFEVKKVLTWVMCESLFFKL